MNTSPKSNDQQKTKQTEHHDAVSGWGAIIGTAVGIVIGFFFNQAILLGIALGAMGWIGGALVDRARR